MVPTGALKIGLHSLQVEQDVMLTEVTGQPPVQRKGFQSNVVGFLLLPKLGAVAPPTATAGDTITVNVQPAVTATQEKTLLLGDNAVPALPVPFNSPPSNIIQFKLPLAPDPLILPGKYFLRVRIDGAESRLQFDKVTQEYTLPTYQVT